MCHNTRILAYGRKVYAWTVGREIDVVFILDTTGSMQDNIPKIRDHIHSFVEVIEAKPIDAAFGLVQFTDQAVRDVQVFGLTRDLSKFTKWFDQLELSGGRDLQEPGYEALIVALEEIDFRNSTQRFFILISDDVQHDLNYDGKSIHSLDTVVARLSRENVSVDVVGVDHFTMKQLAQATGGQ